MGKQKIFFFFFMSNIKSFFIADFFDFAHFRHRVTMLCISILNYFCFFLLYQCGKRRDCR